MQVPVLVCPILATSADTSACLVNNEWDSFSLADFADCTVEVWCSHLLAHARHRLNNDSTNKATLRSLGFDCVAECLDAAVLLSSVGGVVLVERVLELRELGSGPGEGWQSLLVCFGGAAAESGSRRTVQSVLEAQHADSAQVSDVMKLGKRLQCLRDGKLISLSTRGTAAQMYLLSARRRSNHDVLSDEVCHIA